MVRDPLHPRSAKIHLERVGRLRSHLLMANALSASLDLDSSAIEALSRDAMILEQKLEHLAQGRIEPRPRFKPTPRPEGVRIPEYYLFLDECGSPVPGQVDLKFPVFCLSGVIVAKEYYTEFDTIWKAWKAKHLGSLEVVVHEPNVRSSTSSFWRPEPAQREQLGLELSAVLEELGFACVAAVVDMRAYSSQHPDGYVDDFLPASCYLMCIDFVLERFVHFLQYQGQDARGLVVAEGRGPLEDVKVHAEFIRLQLEGTQYIPSSTFRRQLRPYIEFYPKKKNNSGLQIADLSARPFAEKVIDPSHVPDRWNVFGHRLYDGMQDAPHKYGLKVFPLTLGNDPFPDLPRKAKGDA